MSDIENVVIEEEEFYDAEDTPLAPTASGIAADTNVEREIQQEVDEARKERTLPLAEKKERKKRILSEKQLAVLERARQSKRDKAVLKKAETTIISRKKKEDDEDARIQALVDKRFADMKRQQESTPGGNSPKPPNYVAGANGVSPSLAPAPVPVQAPVQKTPEEIQDEKYLRIAREIMYGKKTIY